MPLFFLFPGSAAGTARLALEYSSSGVTSALNLFRQSHKGVDEFQR